MFADDPKRTFSSSWLPRLRSDAALTQSSHRCAGYERLFIDRRRAQKIFFCDGSGAGESGPHIARHYPGEPMDHLHAANAETITLSQAKKLVQCMAHEQSFLFLSAPGVGKSEMVAQAAAEARLPCRSLLG